MTGVIYILTNPSFPQYEKSVMRTICRKDFVNSTVPRRSLTPFGPTLRMK